MGYRLTDKGEKAWDILYVRGASERSSMEGRVLGVLSAVRKGRLLHLAVVSLRVGDSLGRMGINHPSCEDVLEKLVEEGLVEEI